MKNTLVVLALSALFLTSCNKEDNTLAPSDSQQSANVPSNARIGAVPSSFTQKVLLENFTSAANGKCPFNDYLINQAMTQHPDQVIAASFHKNDIMRTAATTELFNITGSNDPLKLPAIMVNRIPVNNTILIPENTPWGDIINSEVNSTQNCGLAIKSEFTSATNKINVYVHAGFSSNNSGSYNICAYLVENNFMNSGSEYNQANAYNSNSQSPFYQAGNPIAGYVYNNVMRKVLTTITGIPIPASCQIRGGQMIHQFTAILPPGINTANCSIVAFIYDTTTFRVMNVQQAQLGTIKDWN